MLGADRDRILLEQLPDDLLAQGESTNSVAAIHRAKHLAAAEAHASTAFFTEVGIGTARTRPCCRGGPRCTIGHPAGRDR